jgi:hypothetical protein
VYLCVSQQQQQQQRSLKLFTRDNVKEQKETNYMKIPLQENDNNEKMRENLGVNH